uniref:RNA helicase n=1 Tax=Chromera velia CCMP2878 TaxID=1169474 RepID=A0A0G4GC89_9ALVE|eukprot:Cvel_21264.t1-p1 / transcript=Cvel_21264.t1 / gene=Cvel_21264 / organism=Chromera_velia_CCMP2878 / gene_product=ATP-dependent RNA helicase DBP2, putative / transcript_product=ATP-dependent RNA helicase DBP2, putative / location=Cvel_scaffold1978:20816-30240(-) / protein_length=1432 / sequence_SO=supercontig / SO=protein_coding / is_pseudo=false
MNRANTSRACSFQIPELQDPQETFTKFPTPPILTGSGGDGGKRLEPFGSASATPEPTKPKPTPDLRSVQKGEELGPVNGGDQDKGEKGGGEVKDGGETVRFCGRQSAELPVEKERGAGGHSLNRKVEGEREGEGNEGEKEGGEKDDRVAAEPLASSVEGEGEESEREGRTKVLFLLMLPVEKERGAGGHSLNRKVEGEREGEGNEGEKEGGEKDDRVAAEPLASSVEGEGEESEREVRDGEAPLHPPLPDPTGSEAEDREKEAEGFEPIPVLVPVPVVAPSPNPTGEDEGALPPHEVSRLDLEEVGGEQNCDDAPITLRARLMPVSPARQQQNDHDQTAPRFGKETPRAVSAPPPPSGRSPLRSSRTLTEKERGLPQETPSRGHSPSSPAGRRRSSLVESVSSSRAVSAPPPPSGRSPLRSSRTLTEKERELPQETPSRGHSPSSPAGRRRSSLVESVSSSRPHSPTPPFRHLRTVKKGEELGPVNGSDQDEGEKGGGEVSDGEETVRFCGRQSAELPVEKQRGAGGQSLNRKVEGDREGEGGVMEGKEEKDEDQRLPPPPPGTGEQKETTEDKGSVYLNPRLQSLMPHLLFPFPNVAEGESEQDAVSSNMQPVEGERGERSNRKAAPFLPRLEALLLLPLPRGGQEDHKGKGDEEQGGGGSGGDGGKRLEPFGSASATPKPTKSKPTPDLRNVEKKEELGPVNGGDQDEGEKGGGEIRDGEETVRLCGTQSAELPVEKQRGAGGHSLNRKVEEDREGDEGVMEGKEVEEKEEEMPITVGPNGPADMMRVYSHALPVVHLPRQAPMQRHGAPTAFPFPARPRGDLALPVGGGRERPPGPPNVWKTNASPVGEVLQPKHERAEGRVADIIQRPFVEYGGTEDPLQAARGGGGRGRIQKDGLNNGPRVDRTNAQSCPNLTVTGGEEVKDGWQKAVRFCAAKAEPAGDAGWGDSGGGGDGDGWGGGFGGGAGGFGASENTGGDTFNFDGAAEWAPPGAEKANREFDWEEIEKKLTDVQEEMGAYGDVQKCPYVLHPDVEAMSSHQAKVIREEHQIMVAPSKDVPKPICSFEQASFPPYIMKAIEELSMAPLNEGDGPICLVIAPTRELSTQIQEEVVKLAKSSQSVLRTALLIGGTGTGRQARMMENKPNVVIGSPGRLIDFIQRGDLRLNRCSMLVLDEADRLLKQGFEIQVRKISQMIRKDRQTLFFSATFDDALEDLAKALCHENPVWVRVGSSKLRANPDIRQLFRFPSGYKEKLELTQSLCESVDANAKTLIFCRTKKDVDKVTGALRDNSIEAYGIHEDKRHDEREYVMRAFKAGACKVLVATDLASRGLDIKGLDYVVNFDMPNLVEDYVHRIGRTGRIGVKGTAISFLDDMLKFDPSQIIDLLNQVGQPVPEMLHALADGTYVRPKPPGRDDKDGGGRGGRGGGRGN